MRCAAGGRVTAWCAAAWRGEARGAWAELTEANPLPAVTGRTCPAPCVAAGADADVVERALGDLAIEEGWALDVPEVAAGPAVLVVGSGPAGLSAAYQLRRHGYEVTVRERCAEPGGRLRGLPAGVLPPEVVVAEIGRLTATGIRLELGRTADPDAEGFDAVLRPAGARTVPASVAGGAVCAARLVQRLEGALARS